MTDSLVLDALLFAQDKHKRQTRKGSGLPYISHPIEVAGIVAAVSMHHPHPLASLAVSLLHDVPEEDKALGIEKSLAEIEDRFGLIVHSGVDWLTNRPNQGVNRRQRKAIERERIAQAPGWVQDVRLGDVISNVRSVRILLPDFAEVYLLEKSLLVDALQSASPELRREARRLIDSETALLANDKFGALATPKKSI